jgi:UrcA family protein
MKTLTLALVTAALATSPVFAGQLPAPAQAVTIKVSAAGLNLTDARDVARLQQRVDKAIARACTPGGVYRAYQVADANCTNRMASESSTIVASLTRDSKVRSAEF